MDMMSNGMKREKNGTRYLLQLDLCQCFPKINYNAVIKSLFRRAMEHKQVKKDNAQRR